MRSLENSFYPQDCFFFFHECPKNSMQDVLPNWAHYTYIVWHGSSFPWNPHPQCYHHHHHPLFSCCWHSPCHLEFWCLRELWHLAPHLGRKRLKRTRDELLWERWRISRMLILDIASSLTRTLLTVPGSGANSFQCLSLRMSLYSEGLGWLGVCKKCPLVLLYPHLIEKTWPNILELRRLKFC